jgi:hypothetical protein
MFIVLGSGRGPQSNFFRVDTLKKLARTAYEFSRSPGPRVKAFLLRLNLDFKNRKKGKISYTVAAHI